MNTPLDSDIVRNQALLHYLANLANSNDKDDIFDFEFVQSLVRNGADINCMDTNGQTIFHEVARSWNVDVALFLVENGANVNHQDTYGRSPLHVAAAVDYASMVEFILQHGGDVNIKTKGEEQTAIYYAVKNDAINSLQMLLGHGAKIDDHDSRNRTPLQVAAEMNSFKAAKLLVSEGAPAGVYDHMGNSALSLLIEKIPEVALIALDQFHTVDYINRREFYFLNYLEGAKLKEGLQETPARSPLEIAVQNKRFGVIMHPVMRQLIAIKWKIYGKRGAIMDLALNLIYTILWTIEGVTMPKYCYELVYPVDDNIWRFIIDGFIILFTFWEIKKQIKETRNARRELVKWRESRSEQLEKDKAYCHLRWRQEEKYLNSEIEAVIFYGAKNFKNIGNVTKKVEYWVKINMYAKIVTLIVLWLRIFKYARPFENAGPYVVIFSNVVGDILKWLVLNTAIFIPFTCAFWIAFGLNSQHPAEGYTDISSLLYNIFLMIIVGGYEWKELEKADKTMARLLCGTFILAAAVITLNLLVALVTNTFEQHYKEAVANAVMQRARTILLLQSTMGNKKLQLYYKYIKSNASPQIIQNKHGRLMGNKSKDRANIERVYDDVLEIKSVLAKRFGKHYGKGTKSDLEIVREDLGKVKRSGKELAKDIKNLKLILYGLGTQHLSPVATSARSKTENTEHLNDGKESTSENRKTTNNDKRNKSKNPTTNKNSPVNEDTPNSSQLYSGNISNHQPEELNERVPSPLVLHSHLGNITLPKSVGW
ncbi:transient receptor potential cation channel subfamily A member 1-like [Dendronephthya gigantea]|uniref:transient receptor potential cation channel subfamily A member 1-like n=1 Tax=Dendronephthya gigantea TaxID=151771 RepID=UPI00106B509B|nr:transient receptor potential cation channel subfamily A member 1-like [Dendronephthya gigantea]